MPRLSLSKLTGPLPNLGWLYAAALLPGLLVGVGLSYAIYHSERQAAEQGAMQTARALMQAIDSELLKAQSTAVALSKAESLKAGHVAAFYAQAHEVLQALGSGNQYVLSDLKGQQLFSTAKPLTEPVPQPANAERLERVVKKDLPVISSLYAEPVHKRPMFSIDVPVFQSGKPAYVLSVGLFPEQFNGLLGAQKLPEGWVATVLDAQDTVVASSLNPEQMVARKATEDLRQKIALRREGSTVSQSPDGKANFVAFEKSGQTQWTVTVGVAQELLYRNVCSLWVLVGLSLLVFLGCAVALVWFFSTQVSRALTAVAAAVNAPPVGETFVLAPTNSGVAEIDKLAGQFNVLREAHQHMEKRVRDMAFYDSLTSLANRRLLVERLQQALAHNKRMGYRGALLFIDIDNFKSLNDVHGRVVGDLLLCELGARLEQNVREVDTVSRVGGDEFVVLLVGLRNEEPDAALDVLQLAEKIRSRLAQPYFLSVQTDDPLAQAVEQHCTVSVGVTLFSDQDAGPGEIMERANAAMRQAKSAGRNAVRFYTAAV